jgi:hypothetical protein
MLAQIDFLDETIATPSERIEELTALPRVSSSCWTRSPASTGARPS